ncbi:LGFP repeat-containing protein [Antrihabitans cavernicola]|uniref:Esterase n=1 Tax=Antrihabitans cavernicola TaxID=2495913 RepID=A0A5A7SI66_9NOCA|nr:esterase [Spelaeibacter cavernicola]KAA0023921.1 esterase [Spelaeibacter cavernicola]
MQHIARRTAGFTAAFAAIALIAVGCGDDSKTPSVGDLTASAKSAVSSATDSAKSAVDSATASAGASGSEGASGAEGSGAEGSGAAGSGAAGAEGAGGTTQINTPSGEVTVAGGVLDKYKSVGADTGTLGLPTGPEQTDNKGGKYQEFDGGIIYAGANTPAHIVWGEIRKAWEADGGANGQLGAPLTDEHPIANGLQSDFENGNITYINGQTAVVPK